MRVDSHSSRQEHHKGYRVDARTMSLGDSRPARAIRLSFLSGTRCSRHRQRERVRESGGPEEVYLAGMEKLVSTSAYMSHSPGSHEETVPRPVMLLKRPVPATNVIVPTCLP